MQIVDEYNSHELTLIDYMKNSDEWQLTDGHEYFTPRRSSEDAKKWIITYFRQINVYLPPFWGSKEDILVYLKEQAKVVFNKMIEDETGCTKEELGCKFLTCNELPPKLKFKRERASSRKSFKHYRSEATPDAPIPSPEALFEKFISEGDREFEYNPNYYMPILELKDMYSAWRRENGYEKEAWYPKIYNMAFQEKGLYVNDTSTTLTYLGRKITGQYVYGIQPAA